MPLMDPFAGTDHLFNAGCLRCGRPDKLVDTEAHIPYEGYVAICAGCVADLAREAGYDLTPRAAERVKAAEARATLAEEALRDTETLLAAMHASYERARKRQAKEAADVAS